MRHAISSKCHTDGGRTSLVCSIDREEWPPLNRGRIVCVRLPLRIEVQAVSLAALVVLGRALAVFRNRQVLPCGSQAPSVRGAGDVYVLQTLNVGREPLSLSHNFPTLPAYELTCFPVLIRRRRLPVVMVRLKMSETLTEAATYIEQGHVRVGPHAVTDPAVRA